MRQNSYKPVIIFSVSHPDKTPEVNKRNTHDATSTLLGMGIDLKQVNGKYKGVTEDSFMVPAEHHATIALFCLKYDQESYLHLNAYRVATLVTVGVTKAADTKEVIGTFTQVSEDEALSHDSWTERGGFYYIVKD